MNRKQLDARGLSDAFHRVDFLLGIMGEYVDRHHRIL